VAFSADAQMLAAAYVDGTILVWDLETGQRRSSLAGKAAVGGLVFSPDGRKLAVAAGNRVILWNLERGDTIYSFGEHAGAVSCLVFSPDGRRLFTGSADQTVKVIEPGRGQHLLTLDDHKAAVTRLTISPDGQRLVSADAAGAVHVWQAAPR
jgi:WD40 repeat protein